MNGSIKFFKGVHKIFVISDEKVQTVNIYFNKKEIFLVVEVNRKKVYFIPAELLNLCSVRSQPMTMKSVINYFLMNAYDSR